MVSPASPLRIVMAKVGLDGHDRGVKVVARALRDAGYEVIYTGLRQTPEMVVDAALQEDAQVIGLSLHSGAHMTLFPAVVEELRRRDATDIVVFGGGIIPDEDVVELKKMGVAELFTPGTPLQDIVEWLRRRFPDGARPMPGELATGQPPP
jgi:methylmalonyl-CoA mutase C-terminal domain/subunit